MDQCSESGFLKYTVTPGVWDLPSSQGIQFFNRFYMDPAVKPQDDR